MTYKLYRHPTGEVGAVVRTLDEACEDVFYKNERGSGVVVMEYPDEYITFRMEFEIADIAGRGESPHDEIVMVPTDVNDVDVDAYEGFCQDQ